MGGAMSPFRRARAEARERSAEERAAAERAARRALAVRPNRSPNRVEPEPEDEPSP